MVQYDPFSVATEIREQISSDKRRLGFLIGAGTSMAVGLPGIIALTDKVEDMLSEKEKTQYQAIRTSLGSKGNVEEILNRVRLYREVIGDSDDREIDDIKGKTDAMNLDASICRAIYETVKIQPASGTGPHQTLAQWLHVLHGNREWPVELFTLNYDTLLETAMEEIGVPYFDGFIGAVQPFFLPESVESDGYKDDAAVYPPRSWTRLWKLHGSIGWRVKKQAGIATSRITRLAGGELLPGEELMIFPSRDKYADSRKLPFLTLQDRLRRFLMSGEAIVIILGYSFSDEHINEILFQGLRSNPRLAVLAFCFGDFHDTLLTYGQTFRNLTIFAANKACIGGLTGEWFLRRSPEEGEVWPFWDSANRRFTLGDFKCFASFLEAFIGFKMEKRCGGTAEPAVTGGETGEA